MNTQTAITTTREDLMANAIRALAMDAVQAAKSGPWASPMWRRFCSTVL